MAQYKIIGLVKEQHGPSNSWRVAVCYHDYSTGDDGFFVTHVSDLVLSTYESHDYLFKILTDQAYELAGSELAHALESHLKGAKNPWGTSMKVETYNKAEFDEVDWFTDPSNTITPMKITNKMKITVEGASEHHQGYVNKYEYNNGIKYEYSNGGIIGANHYQPKHSNVAPKGLNSLPGLGAVVKHPGNLDSLACKTFNHVSLKAMIIHLNDYHKWTREQIADWLDEISDPTGETGPDLRFGAEHDKVEPENPCEEVLSDDWQTMGYTSDHKTHVHVNPISLGGDTYSAYKDSYNALKNMHMQVDLSGLDPELLKLMTGE